jgi:ribosomal protein L23
VELLLQSKVKAIRTVRIPSRTKRLGRFVGTSNPRKKAYVELVEGAKASE